MGTRILLVDDDPKIVPLLARGLAYEGFEVFTAADGNAGLAAASAHEPHVVLLDIAMPGPDGFEVCRRLRAMGDAAIIMLTARDEVVDKVGALNLGADDYVAKPFAFDELVARIRAVLRRRAPEQASETVTIGELALDAATHRVTWRGHSLKVGPTEFKLLNYLMKHPERVHSRSQLLDKVWGDHVFIEERTVDVHVKRLRESLGGAGAMIETVRGAGYRLAARSPAASGAAA
jgi:two-component system, OmpR family, phosphate regulon response regulator PhoB